MDRKLILSVAGSGKTKLLIDLLNERQRFLVVTYTDKNTDNINRRILRKFGYHPKNITVYTYFEFLMAVCYRPFLADRVKAKGIYWKMPDAKTLKFKRNNPAFYLNSQHYLYHNRIAYICEQYAEDIAKRIAKYYDCFYYDEAQDLHGHDFNLIRKVIPDGIETLIVGDFFQHTFATSKDGIVNKSLYDEITKYKKRWIEAGYEIDEKTLSNSYRCSSSICQFIRDKIGIDIYSVSNNMSEIREIKTESEADAIIMNNSIPKLFYNDAHKYACHSLNWGESKGLDDFEDVCIVLNKATQNAFHSNTLHKLAPTSRNKFYVACTRAKRNIYFIPISLLEKYKRNKYTE